MLSLLELIIYWQKCTKTLYFLFFLKLHTKTKFTYGVQCKELSFLDIRLLHIHMHSVVNYSKHSCANILREVNAYLKCVTQDIRIGS